MTLQELLDELGRVSEVHPDALDAHVWLGTNGDLFSHVDVRFSKHYKPARLILECPEGG